ARGVGRPPGSNGSYGLFPVTATTHSNNRCARAGGQSCARPPLRDTVRGHQRSSGATESAQRVVSDERRSSARRRTSLPHRRIRLHSVFTTESGARCSFDTERTDLTPPPEESGRADGSTQPLGPHRRRIPSLHPPTAR